MPHTERDGERLPLPRPTGANRDKPIFEPRGENTGEFRLKSSLPINTDKLDGTGSGKKRNIRGRGRNAIRAWEEARHRGSPGRGRANRVACT